MRETRALESRSKHVAANSFRVKRLKAQDDLTESQTAASLSLGVLESGTVDHLCPNYGIQKLADMFLCIWKLAAASIRHMQHFHRAFCAAKLGKLA